mgnify:CR=1 FL=1
MIRKVGELERAVIPIEIRRKHGIDKKATRVFVDEKNI